MFWKIREILSRYKGQYTPLDLVYAHNRYGRDSVEHCSYLYDNEGGWAPRVVKEIPLCLIS